MEASPNDYIAYARQLSTNGCYSKSLDTYLLAFEDYPLSKDHYEPEFRLVLSKLTDLLATSGKMEDIFQNYTLALAAFPNNIYILNDVGKYLYKFKFYPEAWAHFVKALSIHAGYVSPEKNLNSVKNLLVERWHFRMLNDKVRNHAYHKAILQTLKPLKDSVFDIGCGTGLLSMYASERRPIVVTACDASATMVELANSILAENDFQIVVFNNMSTSLNHLEIGGKRTVIITELFDAGLFGENILQTLIHAWETFMARNARILPMSAEFFITGAKCDRLNKKFQLGKSAKNILNISELIVHILTGDEKYDCEDVDYYKETKYVTEAESVVKIDFNSYNDLQDMLTREEPFNISLKAKQDEEMNVLVGWFNINLTDTITITTNPQSESRATAWQHPIFFDFVPQHVKESQSIDIKMLINGGKLSFESDFNDIIVRASADIIRFLNDTVYGDIIAQSLPMISVYLSQLADIVEVDIVDLCPFPLFGLYMLKRDAQSLVCYAKTEEDKQFIAQVFRKNNIPLSKLSILSGDQLTEEFFDGKSYHAIFCNIFDLCGDLDIRLKEVAMLLYNVHLFQGGLFLPHNFTIVGQMIESKWLDINNRVYDENVSKYKIAMFINKYQVSQNFNLDLTNLVYKPLSDCHDIGRIEFTNAMPPEVFDIPITEDGNCNAILCWYKIEVLEDMGEFSTNRHDSYIDGMAFLANPSVPMQKGDIGNILRCVDPDGAFKLVIDIEEN